MRFKESEAQGVRKQWMEWIGAEWLKERDCKERYTLSFTSFHFHYTSLNAFHSLSLASLNLISVAVSLHFVNIITVSEFNQI